jgi:hypothetical protein
MNRFQYFAGYFSAMGERAPFQTVLIVLLCIACPVSIATILHPTDAVGLTYWLSGKPVPRNFAADAVVFGELGAWVALGLIALLLSRALVSLYRELQLVVTLWPVAGVLLGVFGFLINSAFLPFDPVGVLLSLTPIAVTVFVEAFLEKLSAAEVFGGGVPPGSEMEGQW